LYAFLIFPVHTTCHAHLNPFDLIFLIIVSKAYKLWNSLLCNFLQPPVISFPVGLNILLSTLFTNTLNLCSSLNVRDQASHPFKKAAGKITASYILIFIF
jgi:hypothetical protein